MHSPKRSVIHLQPSLFIMVPIRSLVNLGSVSFFPWQPTFGLTKSNYSIEYKKHERLIRQLFLLTLFPTAPHSLGKMITASFCPQDFDCQSQSKQQMLGYLFSSVLICLHCPLTNLRMASAHEKKLRLQQSNPGPLSRVSTLITNWPS